MRTEQLLKYYFKLQVAFSMQHKNVAVGVIDYEQKCPTVIKAKDVTTYQILPTTAKTHSS